MFDTILDYIGDSDNIVSEGFGDIMKSIGGGIKWAGGKLVGLIRAIFKWIRNIFSKIIKMIKDKIQSIKRKNSTKREKSSQDDEQVLNEIRKELNEVREQNRDRNTYSLILSKIDSIFDRNGDGLLAGLLLEKDMKTYITRLAYKPLTDSYIGNINNEYEKLNNKFTDMVNDKNSIPKEKLDKLSKDPVIIQEIQKTSNILLSASKHIIDVIETTNRLNKTLEDGLNKIVTDVIDRDCDFDLYQQRVVVSFFDPRPPIEMEIMSAARVNYRVDGEDFTKDQFKNAVTDILNNVQLSAAATAKFCVLVMQFESLII